MINIAKQLARHIEFMGFGELDKTVFRGNLGNAPDTAVCVYSSDSSYPGGDPARLQIITRSPSPATAYELSQSIADELAEYSGFLAGDGAFASIELINASAGLGEDERRRTLYSTNVEVRYCDCY